MRSELCLKKKIEIGSLEIKEDISKNQMDSFEKENINQLNEESN
jgi:hypothetical protein